MFGTYRTLLAIMVIMLHIGGMPVIGGYAVFGFYILSGYLMTLIMQQNYGYTRDGVARYALNRFLRIYPLYWVSCLVSLLLLAWFGEGTVRGFQPSIYYPDDLASILRNVFLFFPNREAPLLTPPAWALTVEIFFYIAIGLGLSKTRRISLVWFLLSVLYTVVVNILGLDWSYKYSAISAASLPFATGAMIFYHRSQLNEFVARRLASEYVPPFIFALVMLNWLVGFLLDTLRGLNFYVNYVLCAVALMTLLNRKSLPFISKQLDKTLGDFSYPIYLIHYQVAFPVMLLMHRVGFEFDPPEPSLAFASLLVVFPVAWMMTRFLELPIERLRSRVKADLSRSERVS